MQSLQHTTGAGMLSLTVSVNNAYTNHTAASPSVLSLACHRIPAIASSCSTASSHPVSATRPYTIASSTASGTVPPGSCTASSPNPPSCASLLPISPSKTSRHIPHHTRAYPVPQNPVSSGSATASRPYPGSCCSHSAKPTFGSSSKVSQAQTTSTL